MYTLFVNTSPAHGSRSSHITGLFIAPSFSIQTIPDLPPPSPLLQCYTLPQFQEWQQMIIRALLRDFWWTWCTGWIWWRSKNFTFYPLSYPLCFWGQISDIFTKLKACVRKVETNPVVCVVWSYSALELISASRFHPVLHYSLLYHISALECDRTGLCALLRLSQPA